MQGISKGIPQQFAGAAVINAGKDFCRATGRDEEAKSDCALSLWQDFKVRISSEYYVFKLFFAESIQNILRNYSII